MTETEISFQNWLPRMFMATWVQQAVECVQEYGVINNSFHRAVSKSVLMNTVLTLLNVVNSLPLFFEYYAF